MDYNNPSSLIPEVYTDHCSIWNTTTISVVSIHSRSDVVKSMRSAHSFFSFFASPMNVACLATVARGVALRRVPAGLARGVARGTRPVPPDLTHLVVWFKVSVAWFSVRVVIHGSV